MTPLVQLILLSAVAGLTVAAVGVLVVVRVLLPTIRGLEDRSKRGPNSN